MKPLTRRRVIFALLALAMLLMTYVGSYLHVRIDPHWPGKYAYYRYFGAYYFYRPLQLLDQPITGLESIEPFDNEWFPSGVRY